MKPFIYVRALRRAEHTVFSVADGQKFYKDQQFGTKCAFSSGQQVKRSLLDYLTQQLNVPFAPVTFNWTIKKGDKDEKAEQGEAWSLCDPSFPDQLLGGYMKAEAGTSTVKRRSPLSISAMRPLHPLLGGIEDGKGEAMSFDRGAYADRNPVNVYRMEGEKRNLMSDEDLQKWLTEKGRTLPPKKWIEPQSRAHGLFVYDIAIDLRTLFCVSTNQFDPELYPDTIVSLKEKGWIEGGNVFGRCLICPADEREKIIGALSEAILNWRITSNQARTFSLMETLAVAVSDNANQVAYAIRAALDEESTQYDSAYPIIDRRGEDAGKVKVLLTPNISSYVKGETGDPLAIDQASDYIAEQLRAFDYENQMSR